MKLDRLMGILTILLQKDRVTAPYLAEKFEVNRRTINRDIDALCMAGIPVVTYQGSGGGISIAEGFKIDQHVLTTGELSGIITALKDIGIDLESYYKEYLTAKIKAINKAIIESNVIEFDYASEKGESHRRIEPYIVTFQWTSWYVFGFCLDRSDWRMFKLNRLWNLNICGCSEKFKMRDIPPEKRDFNSNLTDENKLEALFDKSVKYLLIEAYGNDCYYESDEGLYFEVGYTNRSYIIGWLLGFGDKVKVLSPIDIANEIQNIAKNILLLYTT